MMKGMMRSLLTLAALASAFFLGFHFGKEKERAKIPIFQEDSDQAL